MWSILWNTVWSFLISQNTQKKNPLGFWRKKEWQERVNSYPEKEKNKKREPCLVPELLHECFSTEAALPHNIMSLHWWAHGCSCQPWPNHRTLMSEMTSFGMFLLKAPRDMRVMACGRQPYHHRARACRSNNRTDSVWKKLCSLPSFSSALGLV